MGPVTLWCILSISRVVVLDPTLTDAVLRKGEPPPTQLSWQQIITRVLEEMRPGYSIQRNNENPLYKLVVIQLFMHTATYHPPLTHTHTHTHTQHFTYTHHTLTHSLTQTHQTWTSQAECDDKNWEQESNLSRQLGILRYCSNWHCPSGSTSCCCQCYRYCMRVLYVLMVISIDTDWLCLLYVYGCVYCMFMDWDLWLWDIVLLLYLFLTYR